MTTSADKPAALMFSRDLFFGSKVTGTAEAIGFRVELAADVPQGLSKLSQGRPSPSPLPRGEGWVRGYRCVILDLAMPGLSPAEVVAAIEDLPEEGGPRVIAFGSHVHTSRLEEARQAGCDEVMPRSRFSAELVQILTKYCGGERT